VTKDMATFNKLHYFNCVVETGSISKASKIFDVQPSSISRQLASLESELGIRLLERTTRNVGLTEAGKTYYDYSKRIISELEEAKRAVGDLQLSPIGNLKISTTVGFGESWVLPLLPKFRRAYPDIHIEVELTERIVDLIEENVDIAIRSGRLPDSSLIARKLVDNHFILCSSPEYMDENGLPDSPEQLINHDCVVYGYHGWKDWYLVKNNFQKLAIKHYMTVDSVNGQKQLILHGGGIALIPYWAVKDELASGQLIQVLPEHQFSPCLHLSSTYAIYQNRNLVSSKVRVFLDFLRENM
jgi:DNA-binding transcriptional LysR family regulator